VLCAVPLVWPGEDEHTCKEFAQCNQTNQSNLKHPKHSKIYGNLSNHIGFLKCAKPSLLCTS
jgi:hypothetical protein